MTAQTHLVTEEQANDAGNMKRYTIPKAIIIGIFLVYIPGPFVFAQSEEKEILDLIANADFELAKNRVDQMSRRRPGSAKTLYFQALIEKDAEKAIKIYNDVALLHKKSTYASKALYKVAQYYYVKGYYFSARKNFFDLIQKYPNSENVGTASYYAAKCLLATGKPDSARIEFESILTKNISKTINELAVDELQVLKEDEKTPAPLIPVPQFSPPKTVKAKKNYTVQIGAYSRHENAKSQKKYFTLRGYSVEVAREKVNRRYLYKVYIGRFENQAEAERFAVALKRKYRLSYRIVLLKD